MANSWIRLDSGGSHWYSPDGKPSHKSGLREARKLGLYPSVTTISQSFPNPFLDRWKTLQLLNSASQNYINPHESIEQYQQRIYDLSLDKSRVALEFGSEIHKAVENHPQYPTDERLIEYFMQYDNWYRANIKSKVCSEKVLLDHDMGIAGRTDLIAILSDGRRAVLDVKTQSVKINDKGKKVVGFYESWAYQLAAYSVMDAKETGQFPQLPAAISVVIDSDEGGSVYSKEWSKEEILDAWSIFVAGTWIWMKSREYWAVPKWKIDSLPQPI